MVAPFRAELARSPPEDVRREEPIGDLPGLGYRGDQDGVQQPQVCVHTGEPGAHHGEQSRTPGSYADAPPERLPELLPLVGLDLGRSAGLPSMCLMVLQQGAGDVHVEQRDGRCSEDCTSLDPGVDGHTSEHHSHQDEQKGEVYHRRRRNAAEEALEVV